MIPSSHRNKGIVLSFLPIIVIALIFGVYLSQTVLQSTSSPATNSLEVLSAKKTYEFGHIPYTLTVGNFTIKTVNNGTYTTRPSTNATSGTTTTTSYLGWYFIFNVTTPDKLTKTVLFSWHPPCSLNLAFIPCQQNNSWIVPSPENATVNYGNTANLLIVWNANTTGLYVSFFQYEIASFGCNTYFNYDSSNPISVLEITSGSTGKICVEYTNSLNNTISFPSYISVYEYNLSSSYPQLTPVSDFVVSATPSSVSFAPSTKPNNETEIVTYAINVPSNVTSGIYGIFLLQFCSLFPMVVAPSNASSVQLSASDFSSWYPHTGSCPDQVLSAKVLGVSGFNVISL